MKDPESLSNKRFQRMIQFTKYYMLAAWVLLAASQVSSQNADCTLLTTIFSKMSNGAVTTFPCCTTFTQYMSGGGGVYGTTNSIVCVNNRITKM